MIHDPSRILLTPIHSPILPLSQYMATGRQGECKRMNDMDLVIAKYGHSEQEQGPNIHLQAPLKPTAAAHLAMTRVVQLVQGHLNQYGFWDARLETSTWWTWKQ